MQWATGVVLTLLCTLVWSPCLLPAADSGQEEQSFLRLPDYDSRRNSVRGFSTTPSGRYAIIRMASGDPERVWVIDLETNELVADGSTHESVEKVTDTELITRAGNRHPIPALTPVTPGPRFDDEPPGGFFANGYLVDGNYYTDARLERPLLLIEPAFRFWATELPSSDRVSRLPEYQGLLAARKTRDYVNEREALALPSNGATAQLKVTRRNGVRVELTFRSASPDFRTPGDILKTVPVCELESGGNHLAITRFGNDVGVLVDDRVYRIAAGELPGATVLPRFQLQQSHLVAASDATTEFAHIAVGGTPPFEYTLEPPNLAHAEALSLEIDLEGRVVVDGPTAVDWVINVWGRHLREQGPEALDEYREQAASAFEELVGRPTSEIPVLLSMTVTATDSTGATTSLPYCFFLEVPFDKWHGTLAGQQEQRERAEDTRMQQIYQRSDEQFAEIRRQRAAGLLQSRMAIGTVAFVTISVLAVTVLVTRRVAIVNEQAAAERARHREAAADPGPDEPRPLGGWLGVLGVYLALSPIIGSVFLAQVLVACFVDGVWAALTTPGNPHYHQWWGSVLSFEIGVNALMVAFGIGLLALFLRRSARFPRCFIAFLIAQLCILGLDLGVVSSLVEEPLPAGEYKAVGLAVLKVIFWVPYMLLSQRVKQTFTLR